MNRHICLSRITLALLLAGCAQTKSSMDLATKTNAVVLTMSAQLRDFRDTEVRVGAIEAARLGEFHSETVAITADLQELMSAASASEQSELKDLQSLVGTILAADAKPSQVAADLEAEILAAQQPLAKPEEGLEAMSANLVVLGEKRDFKDNVKFIIEFGKFVKVAIDKVKEERDKMLKQAAGQ